MSTGSRRAAGSKFHRCAIFPLIKDLAVDMTVFFDKWRDANARFAPSDGALEGFANVDPKKPRAQGG